MKIKYQAKKNRKFRIIDQEPLDTEQQSNLSAINNKNDLYYLSNDDDEDKDGESGGDSGDGDIGHLKPIGFITDLPNGTDEMEIERRLLEQEGEKRFAKVNAREKNAHSESHGLGQGIKHHPNKLFDSQLFAGDFSPTDFTPTEREHFLRERAEQEKQKELRLDKVLQNRNEYRNSYIPRPGS